MHLSAFSLLIAGVCVPTHVHCLHLCEGEARVLCRGEAGASMVAHRLLVQEAKGHQTGISYIVRKRYPRFHVPGRRFHFRCLELQSDQCA